MTTVVFSPTVGGNGLQVSDQAGEVNTLVLGGHRTYFVPALQQAVAVAGFVVTKATEVDADATAATNAASAAATSEANALLYSNNAANSASSASNSANSALSSANSALNTLAATQAVAAAAGTKTYASYAIADADKTSLTTNQVILVAVDETRNNSGAYYSYNGSILVFLRLQEYYTSPSANVASDSLQNMITKLLVAQGFIPQAAPAIDLVF